MFLVISVIELKLVEKPELERRLGASYKEYRQRVPMLIPRPSGASLWLVSALDVPGRERGRAGSVYVAGGAASLQLLNGLDFLILPAAAFARFASSE